VVVHDGYVGKAGAARQRRDRSTAAEFPHGLSVLADSAGGGRRALAEERGAHRRLRS